VFYRVGSGDVLQKAEAGVRKLIPGHDTAILHFVVAAEDSVGFSQLKERWFSPSSTPLELFRHSDRMLFL
jgi:hypothetical protein